MRGVREVRCGIGVLLALLVAATLLAQSDVKEGPDGSNFWRVPASAGDGARRGDIYWARERTDAPSGARGWNIIYVSEGAAGGLEYVSGEIYVPQAASTGPRPLVVWNHGTAGSQDACAPSRNNLNSPENQPRAPAIGALLTRGYVVAMSDYQGLGTPGATAYLNGPAQGKAALDVARAVRKFGPAGAGSRVAMYGFSQGGQTSIWAASLAAAYAPELDLLGVVAVAPAARHLDLSFYDLGIPANSGYFISRMSGLAVGHPEVSLRDVLTPAGLEVLDAQTWGCFDIFARAAKLTEPYARRETLQEGTAWRKLLEANDAFLPLPTAMPILILQGDKDIDVPVTQIRQLWRDICSGKGKVQYLEFPAVDHMQMNDRSATLLPEWFDARFRGTAALSNCTE